MQAWLCASLPAIKRIYHQEKCGFGLDLWLLCFFSPADCSWLGEIFYSLERAFGCAGNLNRVFKSSDTGKSNRAPTLLLVQCRDRLFSVSGRVVQHLQAAHWQTNLDSGWSAYDAEILRNRWSRLHLTTACEHLGNGRMFHRCRVEARWTLAATILFLGSLIAKGLAIVHFRSVQPWVWMLPLTIPLLAWFLDDEKRWQELQVLGVVQRSSAELGLEPFAPGVRQASAGESS